MFKEAWWVASPWYSLGSFLGMGALRHCHRKTVVGGPRHSLKELHIINNCIFGKPKDQRCGEGVTVVYQRPLEMNGEGHVGSPANWRPQLHLERWSLITFAEFCHVKIQATFCQLV